MKKWNALALAIASAAQGISCVAYASDQEGWQFELTPYVWGMAINGDITAGSQQANVDNSFSDIVDNMDASFMGTGVISYNRFVVYLDYDYLSVSDDAYTQNGTLVPIGTKLGIDLDAQIYTGALGYRLDTYGDRSYVDLLVGVRTLSLDTELKAPNQSPKKENDTTDTIVMLRPKFSLSEQWSLDATLSYGVDGDSDQTYEAIGQFSYYPMDWLALRFGYKYLYYDLDSGQKFTPSYRKWEGDFSGPFLGVSFIFPSKEKPVAAAPAPAPIIVPPPAKCSDSDGDGVCDSADQCPNTPPGKRVGPAGCDCDYTLTTHFAFNSAVLTAQDKADLDKLAATLANPNLSFIAGTIQGHTDSVGKPEYNLKLSQRRADAVADYLASKGFSSGKRMNATGLGETAPIADNATEAGRAENRRVVIRRTDCGPN